MIEQTKDRPYSLLGELKQTFRSLRHRNFRLYFCGQLVSLCGTWMQNMALQWLVYDMTKSAWWLGVVEFANLSPVLVLGLYGGWLADHKDRCKVLLITQILAMLQAIVLAVLTLTHQIQLWQIIVLAVVSGTIIAFEIPSRQALIVNMVDRDDLVNAISLNSSLFNGTRVVGPALAAIAIKLAGEGTCFAINAVSYLAAVAAVAMLRVPKQEEKQGEKKPTMLDSFRFVFGRLEVRRVLRLTMLMSLFGSQFSILMPVMAKEVLHQDVAGFGALKAAAAIGSVTSALALASRGSGNMLKSGVGYAAICFSVALVGFAQSQNFSMSLALALALGFCMTFQLSGSHSLLQLSVPENLRGRLMSVWSLTILGMSPIGSLMMGGIAHQIGAPDALFLAAIVGLISALVYVLLGH